VQREQVFDEDYLYFYETLLTDELSDRQAELVWRLLEAGFVDVDVYDEVGEPLTIESRRMISVAHR
jgi:hypothetical protein